MPPADIRASGGSSSIQCGLAVSHQVVGTTRRRGNCCRRSCWTVHVRETHRGQGRICPSSRFPPPSTTLDSLEHATLMFPSQAYLEIHSISINSAQVRAPSPGDWPIRSSCFRDNNGRSLQAVKLKYSIAADLAALILMR